MRAELVYWRPWELLIAHGKSDDESAEMLSWGRVWLIERRNGALADAFPCRNGVTACSIRAWLLRVAVHNPASHGGMRVVVCAFVRAVVCAFYCSPWRDCVVHAQCYVRLGLCVRLCMR